ncbi:uncharacterized protein LOC143279862 isoform X2 [Babylonia areolata]
MANITVLLDPVKTGHDLNDLDTYWTFTYTWKNRSIVRSCLKKASDLRCQDPTSEGLCQACVIDLKKYQRCGQYRSGSITLEVHFYWTVRNTFGSVHQREALVFHVFDWVKPWRVSEIKVRAKRTTSSSLALSVFSPANIDQIHIKKMKDSNPLRLKYFLSLLSAREQSLLSDAGAHFNRMYGFVRNLEDDEESLRESSFSGLTKVQEWSSDAPICKKKPDAQLVIIPGLPFPGYHYHVVFTAGARYWGPPHVLSLEKARTKDAAPAEGPGLDENFAYCLPPSTDLCTTCIVYFKEIPQIKRGGRVTNYTLFVNLTSTHTDQISDACKNRDGLNLTTEGHNNTFLVPGLAVGGVYDVRIQAFTSAGQSPVSARTLRVTASPADFAPRDIIVEKSGVSFDLSWKTGSSAIGTPVKYNAHYCYTVLLQLQQSANVSSNGSVEAPLPLNCVTNMVTKTVSEQNANSFIFNQVLLHPGLTPAFFVSSVGAQGASGLLSVDCFYARGNYPQAVDQGSINAQSSEDDPGSLEVRFTLPCGDLSNRYGRPHFYRVGVVLDAGDCRHNCERLMQGQAQGSIQAVIGRMKDQVVHTQKGLEPHSQYCVGVNVAGSEQYFRPRSWRCTVASTGKESESTTGLIVGLVFGVTVLLLMVSFGLWKCVAYYKKKHERFQKEYKASGMSASLKLKVSGSTEGVDNPMFRRSDSVVRDTNTCISILPEDVPLDPGGAGQDEDTLDNGELDSSPGQDTSTDSKSIDDDNDDDDDSEEPEVSLDGNIKEDAFINSRYHSQGGQSEDYREGSTVANSRYHSQGGQSEDDREGSTVVNPRYHSQGGQSEDDREGSTVVNPRYHSQGGQSEDDREGLTVVNPRYHSQGGQSEDDREGSTVVNPRYHSQGGQSEDDREGLTIVNPRYHSQGGQDAVVDPDVSNSDTSPVLDSMYPALLPLAPARATGLNRQDAEEGDEEEEEGSASEGEMEQQGSDGSCPSSEKEEEQEESEQTESRTAVVAADRHGRAESFRPVTNRAREQVGDPNTAVDIDRILFSVGETSVSPLTVRAIAVPGMLPAADPHMHPESLALTVLQSEDEESRTHEVDSPVLDDTVPSSSDVNIDNTVPSSSDVNIDNTVPSSSDVNIDEILLSVERSSPGSFQLSPSKPGLDASGDSAMSQTYPHSAEPVAVGVTTATRNTEGTDQTLSLAQTHVESSLKPPLAQGDISESSAQQEMLTQADSDNFLNLENILQAAEKCPWKHSDFELSPQQRVPDRKSQLMSSQESGINTDQDLASSSESGLEGLGSPLDPPSNQHLHDLKMGKAPIHDEECLLGHGDCSSGLSDEGECGSPSETPLLPFNDQVVPRNFGGDSAGTLSVRL